MFASGAHKTSSSYEHAWKSAFRALILEARKTAETAKANFEAALLVTLPDVPPQNTAPTPILNVFAAAFVSVKVAKRLQSLAKIKNGGMNKSHASVWVREVNNLISLSSAEDQFEESFNDTNQVAILRAVKLTTLPSEEQMSAIEHCQ